MSLLLAALIAAAPTAPAAVPAPIPARVEAMFPPSPRQYCETGAGEAIAYIGRSPPPEQFALVGNPHVATVSVLSLTSSRPEPYGLAAFDPRVEAGLLADARLLLLCHEGEGGARKLESLRLAPAETGARFAPRPDGIDPLAPAAMPAWPGWVHLRSAAYGGARFIGLWRKADGSAGSLVAAYWTGPKAPRPVLLGTSPRSFRLIGTSLPALHLLSQGFTLIGEAAIGEPLHIASYLWEPPHGWYRRHHKASRRRR